MYTAGITFVDSHTRHFNYQDIFRVRVVTSPYTFVTSFMKRGRQSQSQSRPRALPRPNAIAHINMAGAGEPNDANAPLDSRFEPGTGKNLAESVRCCSAFCLKATRPTRIPSPKNMKATMSQRKPQTREGQQPYRSAKTDASELLTLRARVSSAEEIQPGCT